MKPVFTALILLISFFVSVAHSQPLTTLISAKTGTGGGTAFQIPNGTQGEIAYHCKGATTAGAGASVIKIQVANFDPPGTNDWVDLGQISLTLATTSSSDAFTSSAPYLWTRANVDSISGTGANVTCNMARR